MYSDRNQDLNTQMYTKGQYSQRNPYQQNADPYYNNNNGQMQNQGYDQNYMNNNNYQNNQNNQNYQNALNDSIPIVQGQPYQQPRESFQIQDIRNVPQKQYIIKQKNVDPLAHLNDGLEGSARKGFIKKVYAILALQLLITVGMCFASYYSRSFLQFQVNQYWLVIVTMVFALIVEIVIFCCPAGRQHPKNIMLLTIFTLCEAYMISFITSLTAYNNGGAQIVIIAAIMTLGVVGSLTIYAIFTPTDFTIKWGIVIVIFMAMLFLGIFSWIAWTPFLNVLYCSLGLILFGIYIVIDTQLIIGGKRFQLSMDDYVVGALLLYIDIIQIFLYILMILGGGRR